MRDPGRFFVGVSPLRPALAVGTERNSDNDEFVWSPSVLSADTDSEKRAFAVLLVEVDGKRPTFQPVSTSVEASVVEIAW